MKTRTTSCKAPLAKRTRCRRLVSHKRVRPKKKEREHSKREIDSMFKRSHNSPSLKGPRNKQVSVTNKLVMTGNTQNWKGARPSLRRRESCKIRGEKKKKPQESKKRRPPSTETMKYKTKPLEGILGFNQPQVDREPKTKKNQRTKEFVAERMPKTEREIPINTVKHEKPSPKKPMTSHHKSIHKGDLG